ncbi:MAG: hypothetical protein GC179_02520 [Anaerolineaceae bacterium]|nr:hypothetical protein [Anaerolineaceae bacterium]
MTIESFVQAMPKVEVNLRLEGAIQNDVLMMIAEQNDVPLNVKPNKALVKLLEQPDYAQLDDLLRGVSKWLQQPEDFTRIVYEVGVSLAKQNVHYAEIGVAPSLYSDNGMTFEQLLTALNDGRARVERAWNVQIRWILNLFRDEPRKVDDILRWASSSSAIKSGVVGIGLVGREVRGWLDDFERPFRTAQKKELARTVEVFDDKSTILEILQKFEPERFVSGAIIADDDAILPYITDQHVALNLCMSQSIATGKASSYGAFPLQRLYDDGAVISLCSSMPSLYRATLTRQYLAVVQEAGLTLDELELMGLNAVAASFMPDEEKTAMASEFKAAYAALRIEHEVVADTAR